MSAPTFELQSHIDHLYHDQPRRMAFDATTGDEFYTWRDTLRDEIRTLLGINGRIVPQNPAGQVLQAIDRSDYIEEKHALDVGDGVYAPVYMLIPKSPPPFKPILAFHGHDPSVQYILGNFPNEQVAQKMLAVDDNYAQALAQAGYLVCAVEQRGFGERISDQFSAETGNACRHLAFDYMMQGRTLLGERIWDGMVALSYMQAREDVVPGVMGCTGHSGGGTTALWLTALDDRVDVCVPTCYFCSFKASILGMRHCECNYVPGILDLVEMGDLAAMIAPRPFRAINGQNDPIYPVEGAQQQFETVKRAYAVFDAQDRCSLAIHPGAHAYHHATSQEWFAKWM